MFFVWLILYGLSMLAAQYFSALTPWATPAALLVCSCLLPVLLPAVRAGFRMPSLSLWRQHWFFLPYLLPVAYHLYRFGFALPFGPALFTIALGAVLEELVFRSVLQNKLGILLSSLAFSAAHLLGGFDPAQLIFAFTAGLAFGSIARDGLLPCIAIHFLINLTANPPNAYTPLTDWLFWLCVAVYLTCGIYHLMKRCSNETVH